MKKRWRAAIFVSAIVVLISCTKSGPTNPLADYPPSFALAELSAWHQQPSFFSNDVTTNERPLLAMSWLSYPPEKEVAMLVLIGELGTAANWTEVYTHDRHGPGFRKLSENEMQELQETIAKLPRPTTKPILANVLIVSFALRAEVKRLYKITGAYLVEAKEEGREK
jgi:hypothetical protein